MINVISSNELIARRWAREQGIFWHDVRLIRDYTDLIINDVKDEQYALVHTEKMPKVVCNRLLAEIERRVLKYNLVQYEES